jgi:hypothetical protein
MPSGRARTGEEAASGGKPILVPERARKYYAQQISQFKPRIEAPFGKLYTCKIFHLVGGTSSLTNDVLRASA